MIPRLVHLLFSLSCIYSRLTCSAKRVAERGGAAAGAAATALAEEARALAEEQFLDALFLVAQFPGGQIAEAGKCCYAYDVRLCAGLCCAAWAEQRGRCRGQHARLARRRAQ